MSVLAEQMRMIPNMPDYGSNTDLNLRPSSTNRRNNEVSAQNQLDAAPFGYEFPSSINQPPSPGWLGTTHNHILQDEQRLQYNEFLDDFSLNNTSHRRQSNNDQEPMQVINVERVGMTYGHPGSFSVNATINSGLPAEMPRFDHMYQFFGVPEAQSTGDQFGTSQPFDFTFTSPQTVVGPPFRSSLGDFYSQGIRNVGTGPAIPAQHVTQQPRLGFGSDAGFKNTSYSAPAGHTEDAVAGQLQSVMESVVEGFQLNRSAPNSVPVSPIATRPGTRGQAAEPSRSNSGQDQTPNKLRKLSNPKKKTAERRARLTMEEKKERHTQSEKRRRETIGGSRKALYDLTHIEKSTQHDELVKVTEWFYAMKKGNQELRDLIATVGGTKEAG